MVVNNFGKDRRITDTNEDDEGRFGHRKIKFYWSFINIAHLINITFLNISLQISISIPLRYSFLEYDIFKIIPCYFYTCNWMQGMDGISRMAGRILAETAILLLETEVHKIFNSRI